MVLRFLEPVRRGGPFKPDFGLSRRGGGPFKPGVGLSGRSGRGGPFKPDVGLSGAVRSGESGPFKPAFGLSGGDGRAVKGSRIFEMGNGNPRLIQDDCTGTCAISKFLSSPLNAPISSNPLNQFQIKTSEPCHNFPLNLLF